MYPVMLQWNTTLKSYFTTFIKVIKWQKPYSHISFPKSLFLCQAKKRSLYFTETESGIQKVSSSFRLMQPIYLLKDSTNTRPIPTPVWLQRWPQLPVQPIELSSAPCSSNSLSTSQCIFECQKPKNKSRRGGKIILAQRIKKEKKFCQCIPSWAEKRCIRTTTSWELWWDHPTKIPAH